MKRDERVSEDLAKRRRTGSGGRLRVPLRHAQARFVALEEGEAELLLRECSAVRRGAIEHCARLGYRG
jgi:hypothetical protein